MTSIFDNGGIIGPATSYGGSGIWSLDAVINSLKGGSSYGPETTAYIAAMSTPPPADRQDAIDAFISSIKTAGVFAKLDFLYVAGHDEQASGLNMISPGTGTDLVRGHVDLVFVADDYWEYHPLGYSWDTGFDASTAGGNWTLQDVAYGFYIVQMGDDARISDKAYLRINTNQATRVYFELNGAWQGALIESSSYSIPGLYSAVRNAGTPDQISTYFNGTFNTNSGPPDAAAGLPAGTIKMFENDNGTPAAPFPRLGVYYGGAGLTGAELGDFVTAIETLRATYV